MTVTLGTLLEVDNISSSVKSDENTTFIPRLLLGLNETQWDNICNTSKVLGSMLSQREKKIKNLSTELWKVSYSPKHGESLLTLQFLPIHMNILFYPLYSLYIIYSLPKG